MNDRPLPVKGCFVRSSKSSEKELVGRVLTIIPHDNGPMANVEWIKPERRKAIVPVVQLRCGFGLRMEVLEGDPTSGRSALGHGEIIGLRELGDREQVLVDFLESGKRTWLPFENLRWIKGARHRFIQGDIGGENAAELFRLKTLAYALEVWNENTGALSHFDIDPLPHQIHLVHQILASGNLNWLIADDVGLGKTIETGMLMAALRQRGLLERVLLVTPAGLTRQWKDELYYKFGFEEFEIYGDDFSVNEPRQWKMHDFVIGSMDRLKQDTHLSSLLHAPDWDLIIFDESHRLSRRQYGQKFDYAERYKLAHALRSKTRSMLLLSGTPHQGMQDKFVALLELLRPERQAELAALTLNPEIISEMVYRNYKADVTDAEGNFVFKGKRTHSLRVEPSEFALSFDEALQKYLRRGYAAGGTAGGTVGRAIGFVMTIYRKLASSSAAAILKALQRRRERLLSARDVRENEMEEDERYAGEWEESQDTKHLEFFEGEIALLDDLISGAEELKKDDKKLQGFCDGIIAKVLASNSKEKVLIFTEYRSTQDYIVEALARMYGGKSVERIHGSMDHGERREAIRQFEDEAQFLVSTEAGGEGINLQRKCHILVNYDLPWNPMRLIQRVGRLYRYGQEKPVVVFNLHAPGTMDENIIDLMYTRLSAVVSDLARVQKDEFNERLADDVLGQVAELLDVGDILASATESGIQRTKERIDEALRKARESALKQRELFEHAARFEGDQIKDTVQISARHIEAFLRGMFKLLSVEIVETSHNEKVLKIRLPDTLRDELGMKVSRIDVTFDRLLAMNRPNTAMMDLTHPLMIYLVGIAKTYDFGGHTATIRLSSGKALLAAMLRWQDVQGHRMRQAFSAFKIDGDDVSINPPDFIEWLCNEAVSATVQMDRVRNESLIKQAEEFCNRALESASNRYLQPENFQWLAGAWVE